jgi:molecular chaperone Hsp33
MTFKDRRQRFLFEEFAVRGELTQLAEAYREVLTQRSYPEDIQHLLGELMSAAAILASTIKFEGSLILQIKTAGRVQLLMAECRNGKELRAIARYDDEKVDSSLHKGQLAITIEPDEGERYQGIVEICGNSLAASLETYFRKSEQLDTRIWLAADQQHAAGLLLQKIPLNPDRPGLPVSGEDWDRVCLLTDTVQASELLELTPYTLLSRLYHEEQVRTFDAEQISFKCGCSRYRSANAIKFLGFDEAMEIVAENSVVEIDCQFCHQHYAFDEASVLKIFAAETAPAGTTLH